MITLMEIREHDTHMCAHIQRRMHTKPSLLGRERHPQLCVVMAGQTLYNKTAFVYSVIFFFFFGCTRSYLQHSGPSVAACKLLVAACGIQFPNQGLNLGPLHWECGVLAPGPPGKPLFCNFKKQNCTMHFLINQRP